MKITFRLITEQDAELIRNWIKTNEHVRKWYYFDKIPRLNTIIKKIKRKQNESFTKSLIVLVDNKEIGYIQCYPVDECGAWGNKVRVYDNTASIDYYIGDINYIHKGYGQKMILEFINQIVKPNGYQYALISPNPENIVSCKCVTKCGFEYIKTVNVPYSNSKNIEAVYIKKL